MRQRERDRERERERDRERLVGPGSLRLLASTQIIGVNLLAMSLSCFGVCELVCALARGRAHTPQAFSLVSEGYTLRTSLGGQEGR